MIMKKVITITPKKITSNKYSSNFKTNTRKKSLYIVGDRIVKEVNGFELSKGITHKYSVWVRFNALAKNDHVKPVIWNHEADHIILHAGTNDLSSGKTPVPICNDMSILLRQLKTKIWISRTKWRLHWKSCIGK